MPSLTARMSRIGLWLGRVRGFVGATSDRVYILPTWYCLVFNLLLLVLFVASFPLRNPALLVLVFALVFIQLLSMVETHVNLREIDIRQYDEYLVETGQQAQISVQLSSRESSFGLTLQVLALEQLDKNSSREFNRRCLRKIVFNELKFALFRSFFVERFESQEYLTASKDPQIVKLPFMSNKRGIYKLPPVIVTSFFPFGLFRAVKVISLDAVYASYPSPQDSDSRSSALDEISSEIQNAGRSERVTGVDDYRFHREFIAGDPLRRVDWKASSRRGLKIVKVFGSSGLSRGYALSWKDTRADDVEGKLSELTGSVMKASRSGVFFTLQLPQYKTQVGCGENHKRDCLRILAAFNIADADPTG
jgi:hypothetical protein